MVRFVVIVLLMAFAIPAMPAYLDCCASGEYCDHCAGCHHHAVLPGLDTKYDYTDSLSLAARTEVALLTDVTSVFRPPAP